MVPETRLVGNMALLPIKTQFKGPARGDGEQLRRTGPSSVNTEPKTDDNKNDFRSLQGDAAA